MTIRNVAHLSSLLASNRTLTDYDFWRALQTLNDDLHLIERAGRAIPINLLYTRRALQDALAARGAC